MRLAARSAHDMLDMNAARGKRIGDERSMATPRHGLGAHDGGLLFSRGLHKLLDSLTKLRRLHVIGVAAKACVAPAGIQRVRSCMAQATEGSQMRVVDADGLQRFWQHVAIELRVSSGAWNRADVDQPLDAVRFEQRDEIFNGPGGVTDGEDERNFEHFETDTKRWSHPI